ncbi:MAG: hypothetical protein IT340_22505 [Chloroflexi bacterium]|nr:hypothetical protein [Chloroflexota bacterium]
MGLRCVAGVGPEHRERLEAARRDGPYRDLADLRRRSGLSRAALANLARCGALAALEPDRRRALWAVVALGEPDDRPTLPGLGLAEAPPPLRPMTRAEELLADEAALGFSPAGHRLELARARLDRLGVRPLAVLAGLADGARARVAGVIEVAQSPPTARGMVFLGIDDETSVLDVALRPPVAARHRALLTGSTAVVVEGVVQRDGPVVSLLATRLTRLDEATGRR